MHTPDVTILTDEPGDFSTIDVRFGKSMFIDGQELVLPEGTTIVTTIGEQHPLEVRVTFMARTLTYTHERPEDDTAADLEAIADDTILTLAEVERARIQAGIDRFLVERTVERPPLCGSVTCDELYLAYEAWCGQQAMATRAGFEAGLSERGHTTSMTRVSGEAPRRCWADLFLAPKEQDG